jgi:hypothetical protein
MKLEESNSARDTLCRLEEELINLEEHPLAIIESLHHRLPHPRVRGNLYRTLEPLRYTYPPSFLKKHPTIHALSCHGLYP